MYEIDGCEDEHGQNSCFAKGQHFVLVKAVVSLLLVLESGRIDFWLVRRSGHEDLMMG